LKPIDVRVVTPEKVFFEGKAAGITLRGSEGYLSVFYDHTPLVTSLLPGVLKIRTEDNEQKEAVLSQGFMEVKPEAVTIIVSSAETSANT